MSTLEIAKKYLVDGLSVIPVKADGSKSPSITGWRKYSNELADEKTITEWFGKDLRGIGVVPGPASGNLVVLDFEFDGSSAYFEWIQRLPDDLRKIVEQLATVATPSGGRHIWIRLPEAQPGGKLARYANGKTKIEIRGEGHQVLAPGCPAECHATGKLYEWAIQTDVCEIDAELWLSLCEWCAACNDYQPPEQPRDRDAVGTPAGEDSPGNDFNRRGTWEETGLFDAGWKWAKRTQEDRGFITRPGKDCGISASIGMSSSKERGYPYFYAWTTSTDFAPETPYSRFAVYAILKHQGNYGEAAKALSRAGYGERIEQSAKSRVNLSGFTMKLNTPTGEPVAPFLIVGEGEEKKTGESAELKIFKWMSELSATADDAKWLWKGYIPRGGITLFSALWKSGKSTILSHLLKALDGSVSEFIGQEVTPSRVLYITEEDERIWADRRDSLLIGDHVGMLCRPFRVRPTAQEWRDHIKSVGEAVAKHQFDLVVYDTLSKMWPCREENDAGQVEEALMPLWNLSNAGTSILLVHHMRKSGGEQFVGARGSGGLPAFCEILMEFRRNSENAKETKRIITASGRYNDIPAKLLCELKSGRYVCHGDPDDPKVRADTRDPEWKALLMTCLEEAGGEWMPFLALNEAMKAKSNESARKADMIEVLHKWIESGEIERQGEGHKGSPYLYRLPALE